MGKVKIGLIGAGNIANVHMGGYKTCPNTEVVAVCDIDETKARNFAGRYNIPNVYTDYNEMLSKEKLDGVSVCTWNSEHKNASIAALKAGANVLCEKPMAMNRFEAEEMEKTAAETGKLLMIGFVRRYSTDTAVIQNFIKQGRMGDIYYAKASYLRRDGCPGGWFGDKKYSGGGPLIDLGVHVMDIVRYLAGCPMPVSAYGFTFDNLGPNRAKGGFSKQGQFENDVEDFSGAMITFDNGLKMYIEASFNLNRREDSRDFELYGTKSGLTMSPQIELFTDMDGMYVDVKPAVNGAMQFSGLFEAEMQHFVDCIANGTECRSPARDGVILMKMIDAIYESAKTGKLVLID